MGRQGFRDCPACGENVHVKRNPCLCGHTFPRKPKVENQVIVNNNITVQAGNRKYTAQIPKFEPVNFSPLNYDPDGYFSNMIDRSSQINITVSAIRTAVETNFLITNHLVYYGDCSAGKTSFATCVMNMVGESHVMRIDAQTATQAGILSEIRERASSIKILMIDEIDKVKNKAEEYRWLLSVLDEQKTLRIFRAGDPPMRIPLPVLAVFTCNDIEKVKTFMSGALYSRMVHKVYFPNLENESIYKALQKYVRMINGRDEWIQPAIDYVRQAKGADDIREMIGVLTDGRERLETGEYTKILQSASLN